MAEFVYSMIPISKHDTFLCETERGGEYAKQSRDRDKERKRDRALQQKGFGVNNKLGCWTNIYDS